MVVVAACGDDDDDDDGGSTTGVDPSSTAPASPGASATTAGMPRLGLADDGSTVPLEVGGNASITLSGGSVWGEPVVTGTAVTISEDISDAETSNRSWTVIAREPGQARVAVTGQDPDLSWSVGFVVE